jgi:Excreted virulence factor EspC, type VII ESX diderm
VTAPTPEQVRVATDALRTEAGIWERQVDALEATRRTVAATALGRVEAGVFQLVVDAYADVVRVADTRCGQAAEAGIRIAATLRAVADRYDAEDAAGEHRLRQLY